MLLGGGQCPDQPCGGACGRWAICARDRKLQGSFKRVYENAGCGRLESDLVL